jgi:hypothetical protein
LFVWMSCFLLVSAQNFSWAKRGGLWAYDYGYGITTDINGNVYVSGKYEMNANFNTTVLPCQGNHDIFLASYSAAGSLNWIRTAGGYTGDYATCITTDKTNSVYIAGEIEGTNATIVFPGSPITLHCLSSNDIFLAKYALNGTLLWARSAGGYDYEKALGISNDAYGNIYICGLFRGAAKFGGTTTIYSSGDNDIFIAKYDANGNFKWVRKAGSSGRDEAKSIKCDAAGNIYITGLYKNGCQFGGQTLYSPNGYFNLFLAKYDSNGGLIWVKSGGGNYDDVGWGVTVDGNGRVYVAGEFNATATFGNQSVWTTGSADVLVACYDPNGNVIWLKKAGGTSADRARGIAFSGSRILLTGQFGKTVWFGPYSKTAADQSDIFMAGMDLNGNYLWLSSAGGSADAVEDLGYESGNAICGESNGVVYATGSTLNGAQFGSTYLPAWSRTDMFIAKLLVPPGQEPEEFTNSSVFLVDDSDSSAQAEKKIFTTNEKSLPLIFPNPNHGIFEIQFKEGDTLETEVIVMSFTGGEVSRMLLNTSVIPIDIGAVPKGWYYVLIKRGEAIFRRKIIVE